MKELIAELLAEGGLYRALHDTMMLPSGQAFEVQIRTRSMHLEAEYGLAAHRRYKGALARLPLAVCQKSPRSPSVMERGPSPGTKLAWAKTPSN